MKHPKNTPNCFICGSPLIFVSERTELKEGSRFPQTSIKYRCSDEDCQAEKDRQTAKRLKVLKDKEINDQKRLEKKKLEKSNDH